MRIGPEQLAAATGNSFTAAPKSARVEHDATASGSKRTGHKAVNTDVPPAIHPGAKPKQGARSELPQDQVNVQWRRTLKDETPVYELTDKQSGEVLLQLPSNEVLSVKQAIAKELEENAARSAEKQMQLKKAGQDNVHQL